MSVLFVKAYHGEGAIDNALDYSANNKKTSISEVMERDDLYTGGLSERDLSENVKNAFTYATNPNKTNIGVDGDVDLLVSGVNCKPDMASLQFKRDMNRYYDNGNREALYTRHAKRVMRAKLDKDGNPVLDSDGKMIYDEKAPIYHDGNGKCVYQEYDQEMKPRTAYMWMLSFYGKKELGYDPDPRLVHQIGIEFCREFLGEYRCTVSTHVNTAHFHDHIMQSAFSMDGTHKYKDDKASLEKAREICDDLSVKYGLPVVITKEHGKTMSWFEWKQRHDGKSWKDQMETDIRSCLDAASSFGEYKDMLEASGYTLRETEHHITYYMPDSDKRCRDSLLADGFTKDQIIKHFEGRDKANDPERHSADVIKPVTYHHNPIKIRIPRYTRSGRRRSDLEMILLAAIQILKLMKDQLSGKGIHEIPAGMEDNPCHRPADWKIQQMEDTLKIVRNLGITDFNDLDELMAKSGSELSQAKAQVRAGEDAYKANTKQLPMIDNAIKLLAKAKELGIDIDRLNIEEYTPEEIRAEKAKLMPITPGQKRSLFVELEKHPGYRVSVKYDELSHKEAKQAIDFLKGKTSIKPDILVTADERLQARIGKRYDTIFENRMKALKEKYGNKPLSAEQEEKIRELIESNNPVIREKLNSIAGQNIDTSDMTYYDGIRLIDFCKPSPWNYKTINNGMIDYKTIQAVAWQYGLKIQRNTVTMKDIRECEAFHLHGGKGKVPAVFDTEKPSPSSVKGIKEMSDNHGIKLNIPVEQMTKGDTKEYYDALLSLDRKPEFLELTREEMTSRNEMLFASYTEDLEDEAKTTAYELREALTELAKYGVDVDNILTHRIELSDSISSHEDALIRQGQAAEKYKTLSRVKYNLGLAQNDFFTKGPGFEKNLRDAGYEEISREEKLSDREEKEEAAREREDKERDEDTRYRDKDTYFDRITGVDI